jgi:hypothetical protein
MQGAVQGPWQALTLLVAPRQGWVDEGAEHGLRGGLAYARQEG